MHFKSPLTNITNISSKSILSSVLDPSDVFLLSNKFLQIVYIFDVDKNIKWLAQNVKHCKYTFLKSWNFPWHCFVALAWSPQNSYQDMYSGLKLFITPYVTTININWYIFPFYFSLVNEFILLFNRSMNSKKICTNLKKLWKIKQVYLGLIENNLLKWKIF